MRLLNCLLNLYRRVLAKLWEADFKGGKSSPQVWKSWVRTLPTIPVEVVAYRLTKDDEYQVLMHKRPASDPFFPKQWCFPGRVKIRGKTVRETGEDVITRELGLYIPPRQLFYLGWEDYMYPNCCPRGDETSHLFAMELRGATKPRIGKFFPLAEIPLQAMPEHQKRTAERFKAWLEAGQPKCQIF